MFRKMKNFFFKQENITPEYNHAVVSRNTKSRVPQFSSEGTFKTRKYIEAHNSVITSKDWREEPFHSSFVNILYWLESNSFKIVILEEKLVLNMRSNNSKNSTFQIHQAVDFHEVITKMIMRIQNYDMKIKANRDGRLLILATIIFSLEKVQYLDFTSDELIDYFFDDYSKEEIASMQDYHCYDLEEIFNEIIFNAKKEAIALHTKSEADVTKQEKLKLLSQTRLFKLKYI